MPQQTIEEKMSMINLNGGMAASKFDYALKQVLENINDPNTTLAERRVVLEVKIKPAEDRENLDIKVQAKSFLAPDAPTVTRGFLGTDMNGNVEAHEILSSNQSQMPLPTSQVWSSTFRMKEQEAMENGKVVHMAGGDR